MQATAHGVAKSQTRLSNFTFITFPGGSDGKASVYNAGDLGSIPGYSPWGRKESDTTEQLHSLTHSNYGGGN